MNNRSFSEEEMRQREKEERSRLRKQEQAYREAQRGVYSRIYQEQDAMPEDYRAAFWEDPRDRLYDQDRRAAQKGDDWAAERRQIQEELWDDPWPKSRGDRRSEPPVDPPRRPSRPAPPPQDREPASDEWQPLPELRPGGQKAPQRKRKSPPPAGGTGGRGGPPPRGAGGPPPRKRRRRKILVTVLLVLLALLAIAVVSALVGTAIARFAFGYVERANSPFAISQQAVNLSTPQSAWEKGAAPQLYQTDPQWAERPYGASTLGALGAAPTCLAMAHVALSGDATVGPVEAAAYAQNNGFAQEDATPLLTDGAAGLGLSAKAVEPDEMALRSELNRGRPVICATAPGTFDEATSYIVLVRIDEYSQLIIRDPLSSEHTEQHWTFEDILGTSVGLWSYTLAQ